MITLTKKFYRDHWLGIILVTVGLLMLQSELIALFPTFQKVADKISKQTPKEVLGIFGGTGIKLPFSTLEGFFNGEYLALSFLFIMAGYLIALITFEFTKEIENGTLENILSLPVSRISIAVAKYINITFLTLYFTAIGIGPFVLMATAKDYRFSGEAFLMVAILTFIFYWAIVSLTSALSVLFNERNKPIFIILFILGYGFILKSLAQVSDKLRDFRWLSIFQYYDTVKALADKEIGASTLIVLGTIIIASTAFTFYWFMNRDIAN